MTTIEAQPLIKEEQQKRRTFLIVYARNTTPFVVTHLLFLLGQKLLDIALYLSLTLAEVVFHLLAWFICSCLMNIDNQDRSYACHHPDDCGQLHRGMLGTVCLRPVGTRGGVGWMRGPCACPGSRTSGLGCVRPTGRIPTRTSTRPPHPPHSTPCPYRIQTSLPRCGRPQSLGGGGRLRPSHSRIWLSKFIKQGTTRLTSSACA